jgi:hypothetical protein
MLFLYIKKKIKKSCVAKATLGLNVCPSLDSHIGFPIWRSRVKIDSLWYGEKKKFENSNGVKVC